MNKFLKKVSIIIPVYNGKNYLADAIDSALNQTYPNLEIIVINDGSTDNGATENIALSYGNKIKYFYKENGGVSSALNVGISKMEGDYFSWLSHDDYYYPNKILKQIQALENLDPDTIIYSNYEIEYVNRNSIRKKITLGKDSSISQLTVATSNDIHGCTLLIPAKIIKNSGGFREDLKAVQDYELWYRLSKQYSFVLIDDYLVVGRVHKEQVSSRLEGMVRDENLEFRLGCFNDIVNLNVDSKLFKKFLNKMLNRIVSLGCYNIALKMIRISYVNKKLNNREFISFISKCNILISKNIVFTKLISLRKFIGYYE